MVVCKKARKKKRKTYGSYGTLVAPRKIPNHKVSGLVATFRERIFHVEILGSGPNDVPRGGGTVGGAGWNSRMCSSNEINMFIRYKCESEGLVSSSFYIDFFRCLQCVWLILRVAALLAPVRFVINWIIFLRTWPVEKDKQLGLKKHSTVRWNYKFKGHQK